MLENARGPTKAGRASSQGASADAPHAGDAAATSPKIPPSQLGARVFPALDLAALAERLPESQRAVFVRMREEFPKVDWTEVEPTHQAFLDKRAELPLNLNDEERAAYAAWLGEVGPVSQTLIRLRAEAHGLSANGIEDGRGYYIDGFRDGTPVYVVTANVGAATTTGVSFVRWNPGFDPALGDTIHGGEAYLTVIEADEAYAHTEFQLPNGGGSRILHQQPRTGDENVSNRNHCTHVVGTLAAWGYNSALQGMAPRAWIRALIQQNISHLTTYAMATPGQTMGIDNPRTGSPQLKSIVGNTSMGSLDPYNRYTSTSAAYDTVLRDYPYYMHVNSSGNKGSGYETLTGSWKIAKNMLTIGNVSAVTRNADGVYVSGGTIASTSSRGPTYDGRITPDFVAKGTSVTSTTGTTGSTSMSGTSMASPNAAGSVALLMDYVRQRLPQQYLRSSTYRALLATTADDRGNPGPDYTYGWGILNIHAAAKIIRHQAENPTQRLIIEDSLSPNQTWTEPYYSDGTKPIRVTIAWLDPASTNTDANSRASRLVNDLDLRLIGPADTEIKPYVMPFTTGQGATPAFDTSLYGTHAVPGDNVTEPIEQVYIAAPTAGAYTVQITHKGTLKDSQAQPVSVAVSGLITASGLAPADDIVFIEAVPQNSLLSPGEEAVATVSLVNYSPDAADSVVATLTTNDPDVTLLADTVSYGMLPGGQTSSGSGNFRLRLASGASPRVVELTLTITSTSAGGPWTYPVTCTYVNDAAINGYVRDGLGNPVAGATVSWTGTRTGQTTSDANGFYVIAEVDGTYDVTAGKAGYVSRSPASLTVPPYVAQDLFLDFYDLTIAPTELSMQASIGQTVSTPLTLTNTGSLPVTWSIPTSSYRFTSSDQAGGPAYVWNDISTTGTRIADLGDDTNRGPFPLGFTMPFYGQNFTSIRVCSNGWLSFTSTATGFATSTLPNSSRPENLIAPLMRDLKLTTAGTAHYQQIDGDTFVVQFTNAPKYSNAASLCTFQVVLKRDGTIFFYYQRADDPTDGLVGIQNAAKNAGLTIALNQTFLKPGLAVRIQTKPSWLNMTPTSGTLAVGAAATVTVTGDATGRDAGLHQASVFVDSNDAGDPTQAAQVQFNVLSNQPTIHEWPTASAIVYGQPLSASTLSGGSASVEGLFAFDTPDALLAAGTHNVGVTFTPTDTANYHLVSGTVAITVETPYDAWVNTYHDIPAHADTSPAGSVMHDGVSNLIKYALGLRLTEALTAHPIQTKAEENQNDGKTYLQIRLVPDPDAEVNIEGFSAGTLTDPGAWSRDTTETLYNGETGEMTVRDTVPVAPGAPRFLKLRFSLP